VNRFNVVSQHTEVTVLQINMIPHPARYIDTAPTSPTLALKW